MRTKGIEGKFNLLLDTHVIVLGVGWGGGGLAAKKTSRFGNLLHLILISYHVIFKFINLTYMPQNKANLELIFKAFF